MANIAKRKPPVKQFDKKPLCLFACRAVLPAKPRSRRPTRRARIYFVARSESQIQAFLALMDIPLLDLRVIAVSDPEFHINLGQLVILDAPVQLKSAGRSKGKK